MNITHICLAGPMTDGWNYQENLLAKYHKKMGYQVSVIASRWVYDTDNNLYKFPEKDYFLADGIHVIRLEIKNGDNLNNRFKKYLLLYETIEKEKPDILFIHGCQFLDMKILAKYAIQHPHVRVFVDNHADFSNSASNYISRRILHGIIWKGCAQCIKPYTEKFYGVLPARVDFLKEVYKLPEEKVELLVMGVDDEIAASSLSSEIKKKIRNQHGVLNDDFLIVTGGKIDRAKWQTILLMEAVNKVESNKVKLLVFGSVVPELKEKVEQQCSPKVKYIGWVSAHDTSNYFASADLVVFPGRHSVFWEQVAGLGIPMFVKEWPGTQHVDLGGNVKFIREDSVEEMKNMIEKIVTNYDEYRTMFDIAQKKGKEIFSYKNIAERAIKSTLC